jgi:hypothetical protein
VYAKAITRPVAKYILERKLGNEIREDHGETASYVFRAAASWYNLYSEQADLRSWQTLPAEIRIARLTVAPGTYTVSVHHADAEGITMKKDSLGKIALHAGEKKFLIVRTVW